MKKVLGPDWTEEDLDNKHDEPEEVPSKMIFSAKLGIKCNVV